MKKIISLLLFVFLVGCTTTGSTISTGPGEYDELAKCLTSKGVKMYGTEWCGYCKKQKENFGASFQYVDYVDCDESKDECIEAGIRGYPTWNINGESNPGLKDLETLASLAGC